MVRAAMSTLVMAGVLVACGATEPTDLRALGLQLSGTVVAPGGLPIASALVKYRAGRSCDENFFFGGEIQVDSDGQFDRTLVMITGRPECLLVVAEVDGFTPDSTRISLPPFNPAPNYGALDLELELMPE